VERLIAMKLSTLAVVSSLIVPACIFAEGVQTGSAPIAIYMSFDGAHSGQAVDAMKREVQSLTKSSGFVLRWRSLNDPREGETFSDLMVVKFHGKCNMDGIQLLFSELGPEGEGGALGSTRTSDHQVLPFSELECDRIRRSIAPLTLGNSPEERESLLGRAMGRVLAHELFHVFAGTEKHGHEGVAKTSYSRSDLTAERFEFDAKDVKRIERR
jgi:hypothetical protein